MLIAMSFGRIHIVRHSFDVRPRPLQESRRIILPFLLCSSQNIRWRAYCFVSWHFRWLYWSTPLHNDFWLCSFVSWEFPCFHQAPKKMVRVILLFLYLLFDVIAYPFFSDLDYSAFSWQPDEALSFFNSPDDSDNADSYSFDLSGYNSPNDWEVSCTSNLDFFTPFSKSPPSGPRSAGFVRLGTAGRRRVCLECAAFSFRGNG